MLLQIKEALDESLDFRLNEQSRKVEIFLNDENVEYLVREMIVAEKVSEVAVAWCKAMREASLAENGQ